MGTADTVYHVSFGGLPCEAKIQQFTAYPT